MESLVTQQAPPEMSSITDEDYNLIYEPEFMTFNKIRTVMCRNSPCTRGNRCTFAHIASEVRRSLCMYHFNKGCTKSAASCVHSHNDVDLDKSIVDYKKWKNPSPVVSPKRPTDEELLKEFGEFKISLDEESDDEEYEDESDKKMVHLIKASCKRPYDVISTTENTFVPPEEYIKVPGTEPLVPLEEWEKLPKDSVKESTKDQKIINPFEGTPNSEVYTLIFNQQVMLMNMMAHIQDLQTKVESLMK